MINAVVEKSVVIVALLHTNSNDYFGRLNVFIQGLTRDSGTNWNDTESPVKKNDNQERDFNFPDGM